MPNNPEITEQNSADSFNTATSMAMNASRFANAAQKSDAAVFTANLNERALVEAQSALIASMGDRGEYEAMAKLLTASRRLTAEASMAEVATIKTTGPSAAGLFNATSRRNKAAAAPPAVTSGAATSGVSNKAS